MIASIKRGCAVVVLLLICLTCSMFVGCGLLTEEEPKTEQEQIEECIEIFVDAYNDGDWNGVMNCLERKTRLKFEALFNLMGGLIGGATGGYNFDMRDFFTLGVDSMSAGDVMRIDVEKIGIKQDVAIAEGNLYYNNPVGAQGSTVCVIMVKENGEWKINDITDAAINIPEDFWEEESVSQSN